MYTAVTVCVLFHSVRPERSEAKSKALRIATNPLFDFAAAAATLRANKVPLTMNLGRHTNDHMVSFYLRTPSGFAVEYGWGAREVDDAT